jgi:putative peptidoglycan binding protein
MIIMKKLSSLLIGCSLALAGAALAQQPVEQQSPSKGKRAPEKTHATQAQPGENAAKPQERPAKQTGAMKERGTTNERGATNERAAEKGQKTHADHESAKQTQERKQSQGVKQPATEAGATSSAGQQNVQANTGAKAKKPDPQQVQQIKSQHASFRAQPKPQQVQPVTFNQNYRIEGSDRWQGQQYEVFRSYHPEWHDAGWYNSHYPNVTLIAGGYYFFNAGYWYPAWGYSPSAQYYAYDGPIYVGQRAQPPDQVIADVQALLQQMGYYRGEVDGLLGPLTREALTAYQADQGLTTTAVIDQPTLDSLGLA